MPLGGIGAGCICFNAYGGLQDFSIRNRPAVSAMPDGHGTMDAAFATLHVKGRRPVTRLLEGPFPLEKVYNLGLKGQGFREGGFEGMPRFKRASFTARYPVGTVEMSDPDVPLVVTVTALSPFIPLDEDNSGLPCAILEYTLKNRSGRRIEAQFAYHLSHLAPGAAPNARNSRNAVIRGAGVFLYNVDPPDAETYGSAALVTVRHRPRVKAQWFRGGWFDSLSVLWRELESGRFRTNSGHSAEDQAGRNGASIMVPVSLGPGEAVTIPVILTWHFPNVRHGSRGIPSDGLEGALWHPWYATRWKDAREVALYVRRHYESLRRRTWAFREALYSSTLPSYVLEAVGCNLAILKSPTILRQEDGGVWSWEGCFADRGCCAGSCTHVANYAQALAHLFPSLERSLRDLELKRSMDERGHVCFRSAFGRGRVAHERHAAADGQLAGIMKVFREWQIGGDRAWLAEMYPLAKRSLEYGIRTWDPDRRGVLIEPHHNTYDIEFWGPDGMCSTIYIGALSAMAAMARELGEEEDAASYGDLARRGARYLEERLFNGEYFFQKVMWKGLRDTSFEERMAQVTPQSPEEMRLQKREGPNYQYGSGCLSDGVLGAWMARLYGVETPLDPRKVRRHLKAVFQYNFRDDLSDHCCTQRPGFAMAGERGLLLCSWPHGGKPTLPFPYSDEVWTGIEYQAAAHMILEGLVDEGLTIVRAARSRFDGRVRNPFNEYECGNYYIRALSSYALLAALSGFRYSAPTKTLWFGPRRPRTPFRTFFSTASGFGTITLSARRLQIDLMEGTLAVRRLRLTRGRSSIEIPCDVTAAPGRRAVIPLDR